MNADNELKQLPYGVSDFNRFRERNYYYVDKTRFIRDIETKGKFLFLFRPRRFGKSLFLSCLEGYYDILLKEKFDYLFAGTDIHSKPTAERNSYMIFKLNFSKIYPGITSLEKSFCNHIKKTAVFFIKKYEQYLDIDIKQVNTDLESMTNASDVMSTLLIHCRVKEQKLYIIIDEYDNFTNTILAVNI